MQFSLVYPMIVNANLLTNGRQYCLIEKYGMQYSEYVQHNQKVAKDQKFLGEGMQIVTK